MLIAIGVYFGFTKDIPFTHGYYLHAVFESSNNLRPGSPVRIAGVNVGKVQSVERYKRHRTSPRSRWRSTRQGLPIHEDATLKIRPRIFLEGNFFVDLRPGSPSAPEVADGGTIGSTQTSTPVQLDQLLTALQSDQRADLQTLLQEYGKALDLEADRGAGRDARSRRARARRGAQGAQRVLHVRARRAQGQRARQQRAARHRAARPLAHDRRRSRA